MKSSDMPPVPSLPRLDIPAPELARIQADFLQEWSDAAARIQRGETVPVEDRRFADPAWQEQPASQWLTQAYLLTSRTLQRMADAVQGDAQTRERVRFATMQWVDAMSPANFLAFNPQAQRRLVETGGESLRQGLTQMLADLMRGRISHTDESGFEVGRNLACTPGSVVFENAFFQLIQYTPTTPKVHALPLVMVPPCINKYYILDLQPRNSLVAHLVAEGFTVFMVSWRNPIPNEPDGLERATWDDYLMQGVLTALAHAATITGQPKVNALGFCVGGTLLASALAAARAKGLDPVASLTLLTSFLDFSDTGILSIFVDEEHARLREQQLGAGGLMTARELGSTFSFLRPNDLVWNYVVNQYLHGEKLPAFDLLYWNGDSTNLPGPFFAWYLRNTYLENNLRKPGRVTAFGEPLDLGLLDMPAYLYASREDHIVPWRAAYESTSLLGGPVRFVLGASGHIAGVINPPASGKRSHWLSQDDVGALDADAWFAQTTEQRGSWWPDWMQWLHAQSGRLIEAPREAGDREHPVIEPAPGRYVRVRAI